MTEPRFLTTLMDRRMPLAKTLVALSVALTLAAACTSPTATPTPQPTSTPAPTAEAPTATPTPEPTATSVPEPTATPTVPEQLTLQVLTPADESVISDPSVLVSGTTSPDAVLSVNGTSVPVAANGTFEAEVVLDIGPNVIDVVASDLTGAQESQTLAVIYIP